MSKTIDMPVRARPPAEADKWVESRSALPAEPRPPQKRLTVEIDIDLHKKLKIHCANRDVWIADLIRELIVREIGSPQISAASQSLNEN